MRKIACLAPALAIAACAAAPAAKDTPGPPATAPTGECNAAGTERFVGQARSAETGNAILAATGASQIRWVTPGMMVTMEFSAMRVTVHVGEDGRITRIVCG
jgi:hypothetical protein